MDMLIVSRIAMKISCTSQFHCRNGATIYLSSSSFKTLWQRLGTYATRNQDTCFGNISLVSNKRYSMKASCKQKATCWIFVSGSNSAMMLSACYFTKMNSYSTNNNSEKMHHWKNSKNIYSNRSDLPTPPIRKDWKSLLSEDEYEVLRCQGTERPGTGKYYQHFGEGVYTCKCCGTPLFHSDAKYKCTCGWPGFVQPINEDVITYVTDLSHGMQRIETLCSACHAHLGHVFLDGPKPNGHRYCINSICLNFKGKE